MILHIIDDEKFLLSAIKLFEKINPKKNIFLVGIKKISFNNHANLNELTEIIFVRTKTAEYYKRYLTLSNSASLILFHNLYEEYKLILLKNYSINTKMAWYLWGAEIYGLNPKFNSLLPITRKAYYNSMSFPTYIKKTIFSQLKRRYYWNIFKKSLEQNKLQYTLTNILEDIDLLETFVDFKTTRVWFTYFTYNENVKGEPENKRDNILIGNSSSETNNHLDVFNLIKNKNLIDRKIYIPLNYGDENYKKLVIKQALTFFEKQAIPIVDFLSLNEYTNIINSCSILIMNHIRQQAFNTIMIALANGCKVFLRDENTIYKMLKREGFIVFSIQNGFESKDAFNSLSEEEQRFNLNLIKDKYSEAIVYERIKMEISGILNG